MDAKEAVKSISLQAKNPFELRVNLGRDVPESDVRTALATGDMGFLHSFTTGSTVDGPDTWTMSNGIPVTIAKATAELRKYRAGLNVMSGGFTLSGGEPLMQDRFTVKLLTAAQAMGIHTALDTNGSLGDRLSDADLENIDLVLLDIKSWDPELHRKLTIADIEPVLLFARRLSSRNRPIWLRFVLVPGLTDGVENVAQPPSLELVERACAQFRAEGLKAF